MKDFELAVTRLASPVSLLQIHGATVHSAELFANRILDRHDRYRAPMTGPRAYSIGPMEWLLIDHSTADVRRRLMNGDNGTYARVTEVSDAFTTLSIRGGNTRIVLASDIGAPLAVTMARPGDYARTRIGQIEALLHCTSEDSFTVYVDRSLAEHFVSWLSAQQSAHFPDTSFPS